jgi:hypothetical protein
VKIWIAQLCAVMVVGLVFLSVGYKLGESKEKSQEQAFVKISDSQAFYKGQICNLHYIAAMPGFTNDVPNCTDLAKK